MALASIAFAAVTLAPRDGAYAAVAVRAAFGGQPFERPVELVPQPSGEWLLADQGGVVLELTYAGERRTVLDLSAVVSHGHQEEGLLSLALDPAFPENAHLWLYYTARDPLRGVVARFTLHADPVHTHQSALVVLEVPQPYPNHNGGALRFGPDGMLYLGLGDGGDVYDPESRAQDLSDLLGSVIRIDVRESSPAAPYRVPPDNPFVGIPGTRPETWAYGFRNPWRMSFDSQAGDLWVGDVGQFATEEVDRIVAGANYGWDVVEGDRCVDDGCPLDRFTPPLLVYHHTDGHCSVTGGYVYRGEEMTHLRGRYIFGDLCSGRVWAATLDGGSRRVIADIDGLIVSFAQGPSGELYLLQFDGPVLRLAAR